MRKFFRGISFISIVIILFIGLIKFPEDGLISSVKDSTYEVPKELKTYVDKFFRDLNNYGIYPAKPQNFVMKFSNLDSHRTTSHLHGVSYGFKEDSKVEIYINKNSWDSFNKTQKHYIVYHELSHDILNIDDLDDSIENYGKIMFPYISRYDTLTMDDFIDNMNHLFNSIK